MIAFRPGVELELRLADQDEVLDAEPPEHPVMLRRGPDRGAGAAGPRQETPKTLA